MSMCILTRYGVIVVVNKSVSKHRDGQAQFARECSWRAQISSPVNSRGGRHGNTVDL